MLGDPHWETPDSYTVRLKIEGFLNGRGRVIRHGESVHWRIGYWPLTSLARRSLA
jgi:hypothetical protein